MAVKNLAEFNRQMTVQIPADILEGLRGEIVTAVAPMVEQMKAAVPFDASGQARKHPVHVRDSIRAHWVEPKKAENAALALKYVVFAGSAGSEVGESDKRGGAFQLARLLEFGTQHEPARPFFFPMWRAYRKGIRRLASRRVNQVILAYSASSTSSGGATP
jgi:hypothetical protein